MKSKVKKQDQSYDCDVCIIGAGPAGLACLSALREPYSMDNLTDEQLNRANNSLSLKANKNSNLNICVLDPSPQWMDTWKTQFDQLQIKHLRSPVLGHPDIFDNKALLTYARHHNREDELFESGCAEMKQLHGLGETQTGLWKLPSTKLFVDFCDDMTGRLKHVYLQGRAMDVEDSSSGDSSHVLKWEDASGVMNVLTVKHIIVASGVMGKALVPFGLEKCPNVFSWRSNHAFTNLKATQSIDAGTPPESPRQNIRVLVVGGGLTAVQTALRVIKEHKDDDIDMQCILCSKRTLKEKHFDIPVEWFDRRHQTGLLSGFYHESVEDRLQQLKDIRDGGSVPKMYMKQLKKYEKQMTYWVGQVEYDCQNDLAQEHNEGDDNIKTTIRYQGDYHQFDRIILACGVTPDCASNPFVSNILKKWKLPIYEGFPDITEDLQWKESTNSTKQNRTPSIFVSGAMAGLQVGPDAGNLMGMRRAATTIASALDCRSWLRATTLVNRFEAFGYSSDEESSSSLDENDEDSNFTGKKSFTTESITQSEDNCSTCCSCDSERGDCPVTVPKFVSVQLNGE